MLDVANRRMDQDEAVIAPPPPSPILATVSPPVASAAPSRYGASASPNWAVIAIILGFHAALIMAIMHVRHQVVKREELHLSVVNLTPPAPPPPQEAPPPPPSKPQIVAPAPVVRVPAPSPQIVTTPTPQPVSFNALTVPAPSPQPVAVAAPSPPSIVQGGDLGTQMVSGKPPRYPIESRRKHEQGTVVLAITLGTDGAVEMISIARSSGFSRLDDAARDAVRKWRWRPTIQQGQAVRVKGVVEIPFVLQTTSG